MSVSLLNWRCTFCDMPDQSKEALAAKAASFWKVARRDAASSCEQSPASNSLQMKQKWFELFKWPRDHDLQLPVHLLTVDTLWTLLSEMRVCWGGLGVNNNERT